MDFESEFWWVSRETSDELWRLDIELTAWTMIRHSGKKKLHSACAGQPQSLGHLACLLPYRLDIPHSASLSTSAECGAPPELDDDDLQVTASDGTK